MTIICCRLYACMHKPFGWHAYKYTKSGKICFPRLCLCIFQLFTFVLYRMYVESAVQSTSTTHFRCTSEKELFSRLILRVFFTFALFISCGIRLWFAPHKTVCFVFFILDITFLFFNQSFCFLSVFFSIAMHHNNNRSDSMMRPIPINNENEKIFTSRLQYALYLCVVRSVVFVLYSLI